MPNITSLLKGAVKIPVYTLRALGATVKWGVACVTVYQGAKHIYADAKRGYAKAQNRKHQAPDVLTALHNISEMATYCLREDTILTEKDRANEICLIAKGEVRAGYRLGALTEKDVFAEGNVLHVSLPNAEILEVSIDPKEWDFYEEKGEWKEAQIEALKQRARQQMEADAIAAGILQNAAEAGKKKLKALCLCFGFEDVVLE